MVLSSVWDPDWSGPQSSNLGADCHHADSKNVTYLLPLFQILIFYILYIFYVATKTFLKGKGSESVYRNCKFCWFHGSWIRIHIANRDLDPGESNHAHPDPKPAL
jgi:hypothetical protein